MRKFSTALLLAAILAGLVAATSLYGYAQSSREQPGSMMGHGMMGDNNAGRGGV